MTEATPRRRVLYIRHKRTIDIADAFAGNQDEWVEALSGLADVTVVSDPFDMSEMGDRVRPDFILYESPFFNPAALTIDNIGAHPHIPRIGFQMQDPYSSARVNFLRVMERMNIQWMFTHMTETALHQSPELKSRTFSTHLLFDEQIFRDYGLQKDIPVSVFGGFLLPEIYHWRADQLRELPHHFPTFIYTHPGYNNPVPRHKFPVMGEEYAQLLNRSHFSLADSTHFGCLVRKHLEIPASGAVLVAPDAPVLKPYGFRDMENCILGSGTDLFEKMAVAVDNPNLYEKIRKNGYDLVHAHYGRKQWRGILDFYECLRRLKPGETIRQQGMLGAFEIVPVPAHPSPAIIGDYGDNSISALAKKWLHCILDRDAFEKNGAELLKNPDWIQHMVEPLMILGIAALLKGGAAQAQKLFLAPQTIRQDQSGFPDYDPEEIAWLSLTAALSGDAEMLKMAQRQSASMRHLSLRRMQWLGRILAASGDATEPPDDIRYAQHSDQLSIHWTGQLEIRQWLSLIARILEANGQGGLLKF